MDDQSKVRMVKNISGLGNQGNKIKDLDDVEVTP